MRLSPCAISGQPPTSNISIPFTYIFMGHTGVHGTCSVGTGARAPHGHDARDQQELNQRVPSTPHRHSSIYQTVLIYNRIGS